MKRSVLGLLSMVLAVLVGAPSAWAQQEKGAPAKQAQGAPVEVAVGYFPSWNGGGSGTVIKKKELWKKYLPAGSTVRWEVTLVGFPGFNALLANRLQVGSIGDTAARGGRGWRPRSATWPISASGRCPASRPETSARSSWCAPMRRT